MQLNEVDQALKLVALRRRKLRIGSALVSAGGDTHESRIARTLRHTPRRDRSKGARTRTHLRPARVSRAVLLARSSMLTR